MEVFQYKAIDPEGKFVTGRTDAANENDLEVRLGRMGLDLVTCKELKIRGPNITGKGIRRPELITFCFHLEQLVRAGVPILQSLADLRDSVGNERLREVTSAMIESIEGGKTLSEAMSDFPYVFGKVFVSLVGVGEQSGRLPDVLRHMTESLRWQDEQAAYTKRLLMYPAFVTVVVIAVLFFLMLYLVPQLVSFIKGMGEELPMHTKALIATSRFFANYWYAVILVPVATVVGVMIARRTNPEFEQKLDRAMLQAPIFGPIVKKIIITRFANFFSILYTSGITVLEAIRICQGVVNNKAIEDAVGAAARSISEGKGISSSFAETELFPPLVIRMLRVGENTGALEEALQNVSYFYTRDVRESIERLQAMIMPSLTVVLGLLIAWIMFSVLGPIYDLITKIKV
jgi:type IV pilus assembly protein PilC